MLDAIVKQCAELFPFGYMHIGGDEVNKKQWAACPVCKKLIADKKLRGTSGVQNYFIRRMETIVRKHKMKMMGWNEILHGGKLAPDTIIQSWIGVGPGIHAAQLGHQVVMSPGPYLYFDMAEARGERGHWWAGIVTVKDTYGYDPTDDAGIPASAKSKFMGIEAALWGEFLDTPNEPDYKTFPRLCALSEAAWTQPAKKNYAAFLSRLGTHLIRLDNLGVHYRIPRPTAFRNGDQIEIKPPYPSADVRYTTDGTAPTASSPRYTKPFTLRPGQKLQMITVAPNGRVCRKPETKVRPKPVAQWTPAIPSSGNDAWLIPVKIDSAGTWAVRFIHREKGGRSLNIKGVQLLNGAAKIVAEDMRPINIDKKIKRADYQLKVPAAGNYTLAVSLKAQKCTTYGDVILERVDRLSPKTTIQTTLPAYGNHKAANTIDYNQGTFFWVSRKIAKGDSLTFVFDKPQMLTRIESRTGQPNATKDLLLHGKLDYSTDGKTFSGAKEYTFGTAVVKFDKPTKIKAVRLSVTADHESWLVVQDLLLR